MCVYPCVYKPTHNESEYWNVCSEKEVESNDNKYVTIYYIHIDSITAQCNVGMHCVRTFEISLSMVAAAPQPQQGMFNKLDYCLMLLDIGQFVLFAKWIAGCYLGDFWQPVTADFSVLLYKMLLYTMRTIVERRIEFCNTTFVYYATIPIIKH